MGERVRGRSCCKLGRAGVAASTRVFVGIDCEQLTKEGLPKDLPFNFKKRGEAFERPEGNWSNPKTTQEEKPKKVRRGAVI